MINATMDIIITLNLLICVAISSSFVPIICPRYRRKDNQIELPKRVYSENSFKFIFARPAGKDIKCLMPGSIRPKNVEIAPYLLKKISMCSSCPGFKKKYLPYSINNFLPKR